MNNFKNIFISFIFLLVVIPSFVFAGHIPSHQPTPTPRNSSGQLDKPKGPGTSADQPLVQCGGISKNGSPQPDCDVGDLNKLFQSVVNLVFIFAGFIVASMFMYAGFLMITSTGNASQVQKAKDIFRRVVIGFLIMFMSYILISNLLINIKAQDFFINLFKK